MNKQNLINYASKLNPKLRDVFVLNKVENLTLGEVSKKLGINLSETKKRLKTAENITKIKFPEYDLTNDQTLTEAKLKKALSKNYYFDVDDVVEVKPEFIDDLDPDLVKWISNSINIKGQRYGRIVQVNKGTNGLPVTYVVRFYVELMYSDWQLVPFMLNLLYKRGKNNGITQQITEARLKLPLKKHVIELTTDLLPLINVNMYNSIISPESTLSLDELTTDGNNAFWDNFDNDKYESDIFDLAEKYLTNDVLPELKALNLGVIDLTVGDLVSPKSYNYGGDVLYYDIVMNPNIVLDFISKMNENELNEFNKFLKDNFSSYSGFISYMPNNVQDVVDKINTESDVERAISAFLTYMLKNKLNAWQEDFDYYVVENISHPLDYLRDNVFDDIVEKLRREMNDESVNWGLDYNEIIERLESDLNRSKLQIGEQYEIPGGRYSLIINDIEPEEDGFVVVIRNNETRETKTFITNIERIVTLLTNYNISNDDFDLIGEAKLNLPYKNEMRDGMGVPLAVGDEVEVLEPKFGDIHNNEFVGFVTNLDYENQYVTVVDADEMYYEVSVENVFVR